MKNKKSGDRTIKRSLSCKNHQVISTFKLLFISIQEEGRRVPVRIQEKVGEEFCKLNQEGHIVELNKCTSQPIVITAEKDGTIKHAMDAKAMNDQIRKNQYQMSNVLELLDSAAEIITSNKSGEVWFTSLDLKCAFSQSQLSDAVSSHCCFKTARGEQTHTFCFKTGFYRFTDLPKKIQKGMDKTPRGLSRVFCFLGDILLVSKGSVVEHDSLVEKVFIRLEE